MNDNKNSRHVLDGIKMKQMNDNKKRRHVLDGIKMKQ